MSNNSKDPAVYNNQGFTVKDTDQMYTYDIWVTIAGRDTHLLIQAKDGIQARQIAEQLYGNCYGVSGPLNG